MYALCARRALPVPLLLADVRVPSMRHAPHGEHVLPVRLFPTPQMQPWIVYVLRVMASLASKTLPIKCAVVLSPLAAPFNTRVQPHRQLLIASALH